MLRSFELRDAALNNKQVGVLTYNEENKQFHLVIFDDTPLEDLPISLDVFVRNGEYDIGHIDALGWVQERICPPGRQNIDAILRDLGLEEYDEFGLLEYTKGHCDKDELYLVEIQKV